VIWLISIDIGALSMSRDPLLAAWRSLSLYRNEIAEMEPMLFESSGMEEIGQDVRTIDIALAETIEQCRTLWQGLDMICQLYSACENRVLDECENALVYHEQPPAVFANLSSASKILEAFSFRFE